MMIRIKVFRGMKIPQLVRWAIFSIFTSGRCKWAGTYAACEKHHVTMVSRDLNIAKISAVSSAVQLSL